MLNVNAGDTVTFLTPGAGGWGNPHKRDPNAVLRDVLDGFVTRDAAHTDYGVVIHNGAIDKDATEAKRQSLTDNGATDGFGPERKHWDEVFEPALMDSLNRALVQLPGSVRQRQRKAIFDAVLPALPEGFPRTKAEASNAHTAAIAFRAAVEKLIAISNSANA